MALYFVGTVARYVLVDAEDASAARIIGHSALHELYADIRERLGREVPIEIRTVRPATAEEFELWRWHQEMVASEPDVPA